MNRILIVDDSATVRRIFSRELGKHPDIEVVFFFEYHHNLYYFLYFSIEIIIYL